ncbi:MAG: 3-isopropylmalate dehydrogenase [Candidatus Latescibacteria bacterium]|nr:3-isopropylmalate dehydrogenase [Candidatus Latescibacterota bacterium]
MHKIAVIPGDCTGPEVTGEAMKVLKAASEKFGFTYELTEYDFGYDRYSRTGEILPPEALKEFRHFDTIFLGAIGHPDAPEGVLEKGIILQTRFELDLYINLRPVKLYRSQDCPLKDKGPEEVDFVVIRENTEDLYTGAGGVFKKGTDDEVAIQESINTRKGVERCIRYAFEYTRKRNKRKKLTLCHKSNVLTYAHDMWRRVFTEIGEEYSDVETDAAYVDATCMWMVKNPEWFDVIVTTNMFGDIITDLGAIIQGGLGVAAGGNINPDSVSMFEPMGGSAPRHAGKNRINPIAAIGACQMMIAQLGEDDAAVAVDRAIVETVNKMDAMEAGKMGYSTTEVGDLVATAI